MSWLLVRSALGLLTASAMAWGNQDKPADSNRLEPVKVIPLNSSLPDLILSPDKAWLYAMNATEEKVQRINLEKRELDSSPVGTGKGDSRLFLSSDGKTLYGLSASPFTDKANPKKLSSTITQIDVSTGKFRSSFSVPVRLTALCTGTKGLLFASGTDGMQIQGFVIDLSKRAIVNRWIKMSSMTQNLVLSADQKRLYSNGLNLSVVALPANPAKEDSGPSAYNPQTGVSGPLLMLDAEFAVVGGGQVLKLSPVQGDDLKLVKSIGFCIGLCLDPDRKLVFAAYEDGFVKAYSYPDFEILQSWAVDAQLYSLAFDGQRKVLIGACDAGKKIKFHSNPIGSGNLNLYDLTSFIDTLPKK